MPQIWELIERCDKAQRALSDFGQEPDVTSAKKLVQALRRDLVALDKRLARIVEYYDSTRLGLMGWSKRSFDMRRRGLPRTTPTRAAAGCAKPASIYDAWIKHGAPL